VSATPSAEVLVLAVPDGVIGDVAEALARRAEAADEVWLHLSGVNAASALRVAGAKHPPRAVGCLHPLVALAPGADPSGAVAGIEGDAEAVAIAERLARDAGLVPHAIPAERALYHAAAVSVAGHATALFAQAMSLLEAIGFSRDAARGALQPLLASACDNLARGTPEAVITGPVSRGDAGTVERHLAALAAHGDEDVVAVYRALAREALKLSRAALSEAQIANLERALAELKA
jgi:predicted short-subunit dehydrogenase-like oxidoreductase (DUF2520 family)